MSEETHTRTPEDIRRDIEHTREELADTAAALAHKADVKARTQERVEEMKTQASQRAQHAKETASQRAQHVKETVNSAADSTKQTVRAHPLPSAAGAAALFGLALGYVLARRG